MAECRIAIFTPGYRRWCDGPGYSASWIQLHRQFSCAPEICINDRHVIILTPRSLRAAFAMLAKLSYCTHDVLSIYNTDCWIAMRIGTSRFHRSMRSDRRPIQWPSHRRNQPDWFSCQCICVAWFICGLASLSCGVKPTIRRILWHRFSQSFTGFINRWSSRRSAGGVDRPSGGIEETDSTLFEQRVPSMIHDRWHRWYGGRQVTAVSLNGIESIRSYGLISQRLAQPGKHLFKQRYDSCDVFLISIRSSLPGRFLAD